MGKTMEGLSIIVPTLEEAGSLPALVDAIRRSDPGSGQPFEIPVIDDDSRDGSAAVARELSARFTVCRCV
jgi:glycosyltransferase involved in cell wall biosynthesis